MFLSLLALLSCYIRDIFMSVLALFGIANEGGIMQVFFAFCGLLCIAVYLLDSFNCKKFSVNEIFLLIFIVMFFVLFVIYPQIKYAQTNFLHRGMILTLGSSTIPALLMGILSRKKCMLQNIYKWVPVFIIIMTFASFIVSVSPSGQTSGGFVSDESGLMYQNCSYYAAYAFGLNILYIKFYDRINHFKIFARPKMKNLFIIMLIMEIATVFISGGRGGFVVLVFFSLYAVFLFSKGSVKVVKNLFIVSIVFMLVLFILPKLNIATNGMDRIFTSLTADDTRRSLRDAAVAAGNENYIFGNGLGSVFYEVGIYSHNMFADLYCETGVMGTLIIGILLLILTAKLLKLIKEDGLNHLIAIIFLSGFIFLQFSSYYISVPTIWFCAGYVFSTTFAEFKNS